MSESKDGFDVLLQKAAELRGHFCMGLPLGLKMAQMGLKLLNMTDEEKKEKLVVFVENDKCAADAIQVATGCSAGSRKFRMMPYGKSAATFVDGTTGKGYRVKEKKGLMTKALAMAVADGIISADEQVEERSKLERKILMNAFMKLKPEELLDFQAVEITLDTPILSSKKNPRRYCSKCGEEFTGTVQGNETLCAPCRKGSYYRLL